MTDHSHRRTFLKGLGAAAGISSLSGCTILRADAVGSNFAKSIEPSMSSVMGVEGLSMFKGAPAHGEYPASTSHIEMEMPGGEHMEMEAVTVMTIAAPDDSDNYHFMPHVVWVEPGQMVLWEHFSKPGVSEKRTHTATSFGRGDRFMRLVPDGASHFDSGYRAGTHGMDQSEQIDERFSRKMARAIGQEGAFSHKFEQEGVYFYYCQNHHEFKMAGAVVVGELWGEHGDEAVSDPSGWSPAMTANLDAIPKQDPLHGKAVKDQLHELREMITTGGESMGHGMEMSGDGGMDSGGGDEHTETGDEHTEEGHDE